MADFLPKTGWYQLQSTFKRSRPCQNLHTDSEIQRAGNRFSIYMCGIWKYLDENYSQIF